MDIIYNSAKAKILGGLIDFDTDTIKVLLVTSSYTPDQDAHDFLDDITNEVTGTGYTAGGKTISSIVITQDNTDNEGVVDGDDVLWTTATVTARGAVIYKSTGVAATSPLIAYIDFGSDKASNAGDFTISWNAEGILNLN